MTWQPNPQGVTEIVELLRNSQSTDRVVHQNIQARLETFNSVPEYSCYLAYVFGVLKNEDSYLRTVAGLILKNNLRHHYNKLPPEQLNFVREVTLSVIGDPTLSIRNTAGTIVASVVAEFHLASWPGLLETLYKLLDSSDPNIVDGAFSAIYKICEERPRDLEQAPERPLNSLVPKFLTFFTSPIENFRKYAISCINLFLIDPPAALLANMDAFLEGVQYIAADPSVEVRKRVCNTFVTLVDVRRDILLPRIDKVIEYMLQMTSHEDDELALSACEFWTAIADTTACKGILNPVLPRLIDVLLDRMKYGEDELIGFEMEKQDDEAPDQAKDIKPRFHKSRSFSGGNEDQNEGGGGDDDEDEDEDDEEDDENDEQATEWTLRKCAASGLDIISTVFREELLQPLLEKLAPRMSDAVEWPVREGAILALGAVAEGCILGMAPHLPQLIPYLINQLSSPEPLVRSIACWTLSRYSKWVVRQNGEQYLRPMLQALLTCILDKSKRVQEAACSAFATLEEETRENLVPYLGIILQNLMYAFDRYQAKNLLILYDAIGTLADSVGGELNKAEYIQVLMPPLIKRWNSTADDDRSICPLLECLTAITIALGVGFEPFAPTVFSRCLRLVESGCIARSMYEQGAADEPDPDFVVCALDLVSGMIEGLETKMEPIIEKSSLIEILFQCMKYEDYDVRQSAFALVGDLAKCCFNRIQERLGSVIPALIENVNLNHIAACNNACWALGEIAEKIGNSMGPYVGAIMTPLMQLIHTNNLHRGLLENIAITIGRLSGAVPEMIAPHLETFVANWCLGLRLLRDNEEKESAFRGLVKVVSKNPDGIVKHFVFLCEAIVSWQQAPRDLQENFYHILHGFKSSVGPQIWNQYFHAPQFPEHVRQVLQQTYGL